MFAKKHLKRAIDAKKSVNFADSLSAKQDGAASQSAQSIGAAHQNNKAQAKSTTGAGNESKGPYETNGSITFYCNGFFPTRDFLGNEDREKTAEGDENQNGETMHEEASGIKGGAGYWGDLPDKMEERFTGKEPNADSTFYFDGSAGPLSSAGDRMKYGLDAAQRVIAQVESGQFQLNDQGVLPDKINIVGHSMGGAYAAGLAKGLLAYNESKGKKVFDVRAVYYMAPHQPMDIEHPSEVRGVQYSHKKDIVSSDGNAGIEGLYGAIPKASGSIIGPIGGIHEYMVHDTPGLDQSVLGDRGGHSVEHHDYIFDKYKEDRDGYVAPNADTKYDGENYSHKVQSNEGYERRGFHLPNMLDELENLPDNLRKKVDDAKRWIDEHVSSSHAIFKEKVGEGKAWLDEKRTQGKEAIDKGIDGVSGKVDDGLDKVSGKVDDKIDGIIKDVSKKDKSGILGSLLGIGGDFLKSKKNEGVDWARGKKNEGVDFAKDKVDQANEWLAEKTNDLSDWVNQKSDALAGWINNQTAKISAWAKKQISRGEKYAKKMVKKLKRKLKSLVKRVMARIAKIKERAMKVGTIIKEARAFT